MLVLIKKVMEATKKIISLTPSKSYVASQETQILQMVTCIMLRYCLHSLPNNYRIKFSPTKLNAGSQHKDSDSAKTSFFLVGILKKISVA